MPQMRGKKLLKHWNGMEMLKMLKCCLSGTICHLENCFLILKPHTQLTTSLITVVSHSNSCGWSKNENNL